MSEIELDNYESEDEIFAMDSDESSEAPKLNTGEIDPRRKLEQRLEEMRLNRELRELDFDYRV